MLNRLGQMHYPIPKPLRAAASSYLDLQLRRELDRLEEDGEPGADPGPLRARQDLGLPARARAAGEDALRGPPADPRADSTRRPTSPRWPRGRVSSSTPPRLLGLTLDLWQVQNQLLDAYVQLSDRAP